MAEKATAAIVAITWSNGSLQAMALQCKEGSELELVDALARLKVAVKRCGGVMHLDVSSEPLAKVLYLSGLSPELGWEPE
jgi:hypothetical protein